MTDEPTDPRLKWYEYDQNNSGGEWLKPAVHVFIQAEDGGEADARAATVGIYFDGCSDGRDCSCCGDRWYSSEYKKGSDAPTVYGALAASYVSVWESPGIPSVLLYASDGTKTIVRNGKAKKVHQTAAELKALAKREADVVSHAEARLVKARERKAAIEAELGRKAAPKGAKKR